ncbi:MAG: DNA/RNA nuclease SfsA, partial [Clostridia bacterium]|nr:DNA/RNA nuclease SfsA [Clostridia bacterium]
MRYSNIEKGVFISRPNRFIAEIEVKGNRELCHVKNTGRCRELLVPGAQVYVEKCNKAGRKTQYDLI